MIPSISVSRFGARLPPCIAAGFSPIIPSWRVGVNQLCSLFFDSHVRRRLRWVGLLTGSYYKYLYTRTICPSTAHTSIFAGQRTQCWDVSMSLATVGNNLILRPFATGASRTQYESAITLYFPNWIIAWYLVEYVVSVKTEGVLTVHTAEVL